MAFPTILIVAAAAAVVLSYRFFTDPLRSVPGPWLARLTRLWELQQIRRDHFEHVSIELHQKYGSVVRTAPNRYSISSAEAVQQIYGHSTGFSKDRWYRPFGHPEDDHADIFSVINESRHAINRRKVSSLYSMTSLLEYESKIDDCTQRLVRRLSEFAEKGDSINLPRWIQYCAFDVIGEITVGKSFGMIEAGSDVGGILDTIHNSLLYSSRMALFNEWHARLGWFNHLIGAKNAFERVNVYVLKQLADHRSGKGGNSRHPDFIDKLLALQKAGKIDDDDVFTTCNVNIAAGSDTIGVTLSAAFYHLSRNPVVLAKLREELSDMMANGHLSDPITFAEAQKATYLQAVLKEVLRLHPAVGLPLARLVPPEGATIEGYYFPGGSVVGVNAWVLHRDRAIFGEDANIFRPERWLESSQADVSLWNRTIFSFGAGARTCIGKSLSLLELNKVIPQLVRKFDFKLNAEWRTQNVFFVKPDYYCEVEKLKL